MKAPVSHPPYPFPPSQQVVEFNSRARISFSAFNNFVFVAPISINLAALPKFGPFHSPSLMLTACLCERALAQHSSSQDQYSYVEGLQCCIGKSSVQSLVSCVAMSHVSEFTKFPRFHDVIKMTLKPRIAAGTHILFTVYDVNTKSGGVLTKLTNTLYNGVPVGRLKQIVAFAFVPIDGGAVSPPGVLQLPLYQELPADYADMAPEALEPYRILPTELPLQVTLTYQSTVQPKHPHIIEFFRDSCLSLIMDFKNEGESPLREYAEKNLQHATKHIEQCLTALTNTPIEALHRYFPMLCNQILIIVSVSLQIHAREGQRPGKFTAATGSSMAQASRGLDMWVALADTALRSLGSIFSQVDRDDHLGSKGWGTSSYAAYEPHKIQVENACNLWCDAFPATRGVMLFDAF